MESIKDLFKILYDNPEITTAILSGLAAIWQTFTKYKACKTTDEVKDLLINTLKVEDKMKADTEFSKEILEKVDGIAKETGASKAAIETVKDSLSHERKGFVNIGSYKGKPVYLTDIADMGRILRRIFK